MENNISLVSGAKGGVGKSLVTMGLLDYLKDRNAALLETDVANPDVGKSYSKEVSKFAGLDIAHEEAWIDLANFLEKTKSPVVINAAAGLGSSNSVKNLGDGLSELERDLRVFWILNTQKDGLNLLKSFLDEVEGSERIKVHAVRNTFFGTPDDFRLFNEGLKGRIIDRGGGHSRLSGPCQAMRRTSLRRAAFHCPGGRGLPVRESAGTSEMASACS